MLLALTAVETWVKSFVLTVIRRGIYQNLLWTQEKYIKKLVLVSATSTLVTGADEETLIRIPYIHYLVRFQKNKGTIQALIDSSSKVNVMSLAYAKKLEL